MVCSDVLSLQPYSTRPEGSLILSVRFSVMWHNVVRYNVQYESAASISFLFEKEEEKVRFSSTSVPIYETTRSLYPIITRSSYVLVSSSFDMLLC
jgi:hypothetical protein